jgi:hydroxyacylglutathione hydrolase
MLAQIYLFPCLTDNFGVLIHDPGGGATASIDAPEAAPVEAALAKTGGRGRHGAGRRIDCRRY